VDGQQMPAMSEHAGAVAIVSGLAPRDRWETIIDTITDPLVRRWNVFLRDGYDTFGECWGWGTPVHAWSSTPTKDLIWYVLGVTPAEPGYTTVQVAPRPGSLQYVAGAIPTPYGLVRVHADTTTGSASVDSPVPVRFRSLDGTQHNAPAGLTRLTL
jgi:hypothetical protein